MKIERLIGIITTLQQKEKVTAPYLAEKFEVSRRTINRDIEEICRAGIPIVTTQGTSGGISLMEGFALDTTVFTKQELSAVFTGFTGSTVRRRSKIWRSCWDCSPLWGKKPGSYPAAGSAESASPWR